MPKLTDTQLVILSAAAQRDTGAVLPLPSSLTINKGAATAVYKSLVKRGLIGEQPAGRDDEIWREIEDGRRITLVITAAGLEAIGIEPDKQSDAAPPATRTTTKLRRKKAAASPQAAPATARPGTKQALLIDLLERKRGATLAEIGEATGWQAHSVRGAISGMVRKKLGLNVTSELVGSRGRVYRIVVGACGAH